MKENKESIEMKHSFEEIEKCIAMLEILAKDAGPTCEPSGGKKNCAFESDRGNIPAGQG